MSKQVIVDGWQRETLPEELIDILTTMGVIYHCGEPHSGDSKCEFYHIDTKYSWNDIDMFVAGYSTGLRAPSLS